MTLPHTTSSSWERRVAAAIPEALDYLPESWEARDRLAQALVERVLAAADQAVPTPDGERAEARRWTLWTCPNCPDFAAENHHVDHVEPCERWAALDDFAVEVMPVAEHEDELARLRAVEEAARMADDLLRRLGEWDMLWPGPPPVTADGPYWQGEIARVRSALSEPATEGSGE